MPPVSSRSVSSRKQLSLSAATTQQTRVSYVSSRKRAEPPTQPESLPTSSSVVTSSEEEPYRLLKSPKRADLYPNMTTFAMIPQALMESCISSQNDTQYSLLSNPFSSFVLPFKHNQVNLLPPSIGRSGLFPMAF